MILPESYTPEFESLRPLLLQVAQERTLTGVLHRTVYGMASTRPHLVRACIWLFDARCGDLFPEEHSRAEEPGFFLRLVASARQTGEELLTEWPHANGDFHRVPLTEPIVGRVAATGVLQTARDETEWEPYPKWARDEGIVSYCAVPMVHQDEILGVLAVFGRIRLHQYAAKGQQWQRMFADHAATAIINARAFEEIQRLRRRLELENEYLREEVAEAHAHGGIVVQSAALRQVLRQLKLVSPTKSTVLILGESGTGKELVAREIHRLSKRADRPLVRVSCAAIPRELFESEFFGHVKGAFTGAIADRVGRFELADGGTLFLDEVGELPPELQGKLLRVLQEGEFERVGDERTRHVDARVIAATNRDLKREVDARRFREDLYYRLSVFPIEVAPLRERREDIAPLAAYFLELLGKRHGAPGLELTKAHVAELERNDWPGNVRELQNVIERAVIGARANGRLQLALTPPPSARESRAAGGTSPDRGAPASAPEDAASAEILTDAAFRDRERENLRRALERTNWKVSGPGGAAELLALKPTTLASKIKALKLERSSGQ